MQITPEQFRVLLEAVRDRPAETFNFMQGAMALGATLVSVTGVVVGMRYSIAALAKQLEKIANAYEKISDRVEHMAQEIAVLKYATGIEAVIPQKEK